MKALRIKFIGGVVLLLGVLMYYLGRWWDTYTFTHGHGTAIDMNIGAALLSIAGVVFGLGGVGLIVVSLYSWAKKR